MMKREIIRAVKNYSKVMTDEEILVVDAFEFDKCQASSITIIGEYKLKFFINLEYNSLENLSELLFGMVDKELMIDLQKEFVNTIGGYFADNFYKQGYSLSLPEIEKICDTKYSVFFRNEILKMSVKLKVE